MKDYDLTTFFLLERSRKKEPQALFPEIITMNEGSLARPALLSRSSEIPERKFESKKTSVIEKCLWIGFSLLAWHLRKPSI